MMIGNADEERPESSGAKTAYNKAGACGAGEITDRDPKKVAAPHPPDRLVRFECAGSGADSCVDQILDQPHHAERDDRD